jgi:UDP-glucose:glycoprotein glucosyltransferase
MNPGEPGSASIGSVFERALTQNFPMRLGLLLVTDPTADYDNEDYVPTVDATSAAVKIARVLFYFTENHSTHAVLNFLTTLEYYVVSNPNRKPVQMLESVFKQTTSMQGGAKMTLSQVLASTAWDEKILESNRAALELGITSLPVAFFNGYPITAQPDTIFNAVIQEYFNQLPAVQSLLQQNQLREGQDYYDFFVSDPAALDRFNPYVVSTGVEKYTWLVPAVGETEYLAAVPYMEGTQGVGALKIATHLFCSMPDSDPRKGLEAVKYLETEHANHNNFFSRIGFLNNREISTQLSEVEFGAQFRISRALWAVMRCNTLGSKVLKFSRQILEAKQGGLLTSDAAVEQIAQQLNLPTKFFEIFKDISATRTILQSQQKICSQKFAFPPNSTGIVSNGRLIALPTEAHFLRADWKLLTHVESQRASQLFQLISQATWPEIDDTSSSSRDPASDALMGVVSILGKELESNVQKFKLPDGAALSFTLTPVSGHVVPALQLTLIVDPLSVLGQKIIPILKSLRKLFDLEIRVILNPQPLSILPLKNYYRYQFGSLPADLQEQTLDSFTSQQKREFSPYARFSLDGVSDERVMTMHLEVPQAWLISPLQSLHDLDNIRMGDVQAAGGLYAQFELQHLVQEGNCYDLNGQPPRGLELLMRPLQNTQKSDADHVTAVELLRAQDTVVMANLGYWQLKSNPGLWSLGIKPNTRSADIYEIRDSLAVDHVTRQSFVFVDSFALTHFPLRVAKRVGKEYVDLLAEEDFNEGHEKILENSWDNSWSNMFGFGSQPNAARVTHQNHNETIHVFSLASGHLYERFLRIMFLSVTKQTKNPVKFWLLANFLSPQFQDSLPVLSAHYGFSYELVTYKWPVWLPRQTEKQRIIWAYKILFLDVLFPLDLQKVIYVDADQVVHTDLLELWNMDLQGAPYAYTPFCNKPNDNPDTRGFRFWAGGFWENHLRGLPYHISALYVVDLKQFRRQASGDTIRATYAGLVQDPNSLANLDQDLPNYLQHQVKIFSLPQEWLWCETWCAQSLKEKAKTIDLCNNPLTKRPKLESAVAILNGEWTDLDNEIKNVLEREKEQKKKIQQQPQESQDD